MEVNLTTLPDKMKQLPRDPQRGVPVPWFVAWVDGKPEFRAADGGKFVRAIREMRCWVCGNRLGVNLSFVVGPMCLVNMTTSEPPCHLTCAEWSAQNCPFLARPRMVRREDNLPEAMVPPPGIGLDRNPGVVAVYTVRDYKLFPDGRGGKLIRMPEEHTAISWWSEGRTATLEEIWHSTETGLLYLMELAVGDGPEGMEELERRVKRFKELIGWKAGAAGSSAA